MHIEYWPASDGLHVVQIATDGTVTQLGRFVKPVRRWADCRLFSCWSAK